MKAVCPCLQLHHTLSVALPAKFPLLNLMEVKDCREFDSEEYLLQVRALAQARGFSCETYLRLSDGSESFVCERKAAATGPSPRIYVSAGIHGDEPAGCLALLQLLRDGDLGDWASWTLFPALNPWGLKNNRRENAAGADLNRDYCLLATEEVRAHVAWLEKSVTDQVYDLYLSLHEDWEARGFYLYEIMTLPVPRLAQGILTAVEEELPLDKGPVVDDHILDAPGYIHHRTEPDLPNGWPEAIFHCRLQTAYSYTFETPSSFPLPQRVDAQLIACRSLLQQFRQLSGGVPLPR